MGVVPQENIPMFVTAVFCITGTFMWSNLVLNTRKFIVCLIDPETKAKVRKQWYLVILLFIHSIGTLITSFPNCLCAIFSQACPTPHFHPVACGGYTLAESMSQAVLAARLYLFQLNRPHKMIPILAVGLIGARMVTGIYQCSVSDYAQAPDWGYWIPIQSPKVLSAVYSLDLINNILFTGLFSMELYTHYQAIEKHTNQTALYRMRQILQSAAVGGILAGIGTVILAALIISETAVDEMQIVVIFSELAWNSVIVTQMVNGRSQEDNRSEPKSDMSPKKGVEMSLLTSASVLGMRLEAPEPVAVRKNVSELRKFKYDHGDQNVPLSDPDQLSGVRRIEEDFRLQLSPSPSSSPSPSPSPPSPQIESLTLESETPHEAQRQESPHEVMEVV